MLSNPTLPHEEERRTNMARNKKKSENSPNGWVLLNKPEIIGSTDCVNILKREIRRAHPDIKPKVGHAGTLDPLATGVLILALGNATKLVEYVMHCEKTYVFRVQWGTAMDTDDAQGKVIATSEVRPSKEQIEAILPQFIGEIQQVPPKYSAIKVAGERAYDMAREGKEVVLEARPVDIFSMKILLHHGDSTDFVVDCGKGTYVRSLARDMAEKLGTFGHITMLERTYLGKCGIQDTITLEKLEELVHNGDPDAWLTPMEWMLDDIPAWSVPEGVARRIRHGNDVRLIPGRTPPELLDLEVGALVQVHQSGKLLALARLEEESIQPVRVFDFG